MSIAPSRFLFPSLVRPALLSVVLLMTACLHVEVRRQAQDVSEKSTPDASAERPAITPLVNQLQERTFRWFWDHAQDNSLIPDRFPYEEPFSSIAGMGFALTVYAVGAEHGWVTRWQARDRTLKALRYLRGLPMGPSIGDDAGYHGFYYHFLNLTSGRRHARWVEVSSIDTTLLLGGVLFAQSYYDRNDPAEAEIRKLAEEMYRDVEWPWLQARKPLISMGWVPEDGIIKHDWSGYDEAMLVYVLALGSPTYPVEPAAWTAWTKTYEGSFGTFYGQEYLAFGPQFGHQYSHVWIDFRGIQDDWNREKGFDYFENSRRATLAQRAYANANPMRWKGYGGDVWGLTASDGPQTTVQTYRGESRTFRHYSARGAGLEAAFDDGTLAPTAAVASIAFAPEIVIPAIHALHDRYGEYIYGKYGFIDAFNPSFNYPDVELKMGKLLGDGRGWVDSDQIGIDQGPIVLMIENYRNEFVWNVMKKNPHIRRGLERAGFKGGWLEQKPKPGSTQASPK